MPVSGMELTSGENDTPMLEGPHDSIEELIIHVTIVEDEKNWASRSILYTQLRDTKQDELQKLREITNAKDIVDGPYMMYYFDFEGRMHSINDNAEFGLAILSSQEEHRDSRRISMFIAKDKALVEALQRSKLGVLTHGTTKHQIR